MADLSQQYSAAILMGVAIFFIKLARKSDKEIVKEIVVPGRLVNLVVK